MPDNLFQTARGSGEVETASPTEANDPDFAANVSPASHKSSDDLYREDIFAASLEAIHHPLPGTEDEAIQPNASQIPYQTKWSARLLRFPAREAEASRKLSTMIPALRSPQVKRDLRDALARLTQTSAENDRWTIEALEVTETDFDPALFNGHHEHVLSAIFAVESGGTVTNNDETFPQPAAKPLLACTCDALFARHVIALMTRAATTSPTDNREEQSPESATEFIASLSVRPFSVVERAILEFLFLQLAGQINRSIDAPLLMLERLATPRGSADEDEPSSPVSQHGLAVSFLVSVREQQAIVRLFLPVEAAEALSAQLNPLFFTDRRNTSWWQEQSRQRYAHYGRVITDIRGALALGQTEITYHDFQQLEPGDVLMLDHTALVHEPQQQLWHAQNIQLRLGAGDDSLIFGSLIQSASHEEFKMAVASYRASRLVVDEEGEQMSSEKDEENAAPTAETVDEPQQAEELQRNLPHNLPLVVRVELETRNLTIEEVADLHPGQILALGCRASDPVRLVTDSGRVARGALVEIEGRLGVVLSQLDR